MDFTSYTEDDTVFTAASTSESKRSSCLIDYSKPVKDRCGSSQRIMGGERRSMSSNHCSTRRTKTASWLKASNLRMSACQHERVSFRIQEGGRALQELPEVESSSSSQEEDEQPHDEYTYDQETPSESPVKRPVRRQSVRRSSVHSVQQNSPKPATKYNVKSVAKDLEAMQACLCTPASREKATKPKSDAKLGDFFAKETDKKGRISSSSSIWGGSITSRNSKLSRALSADGANSVVLRNMQRTSRDDESKHQKSSLLLESTIKSLRRSHSDDDDVDELQALQHFLKKPARKVNHIIRPTTNTPYSPKRNAPSRSASEQVRPVSLKRSLLSRSRSAALHQL